MPNFIKSAIAPIDWINDQVIEICLVGRSNVGKSSLINALANQSIAKTSKTPGRTQTINFYDFGNYRLIDLPGYGFMHGNHQLKEQVADIIQTYLTSRTNTYGVLQICDANVITEADVNMSHYLQKHFKNHYIILNKIDKGTISMYQNKLNSIAKYLKVQPTQIFFISIKKHLNINKIQAIINSTIKQIKNN
ncbi:MAG: ribosome biogenesis GTP-binding protein YihA/YsxC [Mycoplasmataceae bacterium]|jgi:GTP-binding protein|nr:ribosome biogenesis GTP-binding protein YihA/YsxC [Mycoplasmataceae bacterium]